ncbi:hypothetical protein PT974_06713 [Cladobotryum mycophilum]|uniref:MARVEL domain-containing protein n=1 Tax=Cladobotryum mycophilum TaxID=491253 RepID=A0ABR0SME9_9HYPO
MGVKAGLGLKTIQWFIRGIQFCCAALILAVYSYFLASLHNHNLRIATSLRAVEGISGAATLYTLAGLLLLCCVAGLTATSLLAVVLDAAFVGAFIYVAVANRGGAGSCRGYVDTPFGKACRLQTACLAVAIIAIIFFVFSILVEVALARNRRREKRYGPSPQNDYTSGYGKRGGFLGRLFGRRKPGDAVADDANMLPPHTHPDQLDNNNNRHSYTTETTDHHANPYVNNDGYTKYETGYGHHGATTGHGPAVPPQSDAFQGVAPHNYRYGDGVYDHA